MSGKIVVLTGASGYIGSELVKRLSLQDDISKIICIDRLPTTQCNKSEHFQIDLSQSQPSEIASIIKKAHTIFHLAAARTDWGYTYDEYNRDNLIATQNLVKAAKLAGIGNWIYYGTVGVYGSSDTPITESSPFNPSSDYATTKAHAEEALIKEAKALGWNVGIIRPSAVFSENQPSNANLFRLIKAIQSGKFILIGSGRQIKTVSYLPNLIDATIWLYRKEKISPIEAFNYLEQPQMTTLELVLSIRRELNTKLPLIKLPLSLVATPAKLADLIGNLFKVDLPITSARIKKFCTGTNFSSDSILRSGFRPKHSLKDAIKRTVEWQKTH